MASVWIRKVIWWSFCRNVRKVSPCKCGSECEWFICHGTAYPAAARAFHETQKQILIAMGSLSYWLKGVRFRPFLILHYPSTCSDKWSVTFRDWEPVVWSKRSVKHRSWNTLHATASYHGLLRNLFETMSMDEFRENRWENGKGSPKINSKKEVRLQIMEGAHWLWEIAQGIEMYLDGGYERLNSAEFLIDNLSFLGISEARNRKSLDLSRREFQTLALPEICGSTGVCKYLSSSHIWTIFSYFLRWAMKCSTQNQLKICFPIRPL